MLLGKNTNIKDQEGFDGVIPSKRGSPRLGCSPSKHMLQRQSDYNRVNVVKLPEGRLPEGLSQKLIANSPSTGHKENCSVLSLPRYGPRDTEHSFMLRGMHVQHQS